MHKNIFSLTSAEKYEYSAWAGKIIFLYIKECNLYCHENRVSRKRRPRKRRPPIFS